MHCLGMWNWCCRAREPVWLCSPFLSVDLQDQFCWSVVFVKLVIVSRKGQCCASCHASTSMHFLATFDVTVKTKSREGNDYSICFQFCLLLPSTCIKQKDYCVGWRCAPCKLYCHAVESRMGPCQCRTCDSESECQLGPQPGVCNCELFSWAQYLN